MICLAFVLHLPMTAVAHLPAAKPCTHDTHQQTSFLPGPTLSASGHRRPWQKSTCRLHVSQPALPNAGREEKKLARYGGGAHGPTNPISRGGWGQPCGPPISYPTACEPSPDRSPWQRGASTAITGRERTRMLPAISVPPASSLPPTTIPHPQVGPAAIPLL